MIKNLLLISMLACTLQAETITGTCKRVLDGDTFVLNDNTTVQIWGIDAPELKQSHGQEARTWLQNTIGLKGVELRIKVKGTDDKGRTLGMVYIQGNQRRNSNIGTLMVKAGMAWFDDYNAPEAGLADEMEKARKAKKGLWADKNPVKPYLFRKGKSTPMPQVEVAADEVLCERVLDGDTFKSDGTRVRLWGIDAPEKGQPFADEARARLKELIEGKAVRLEWKDRDQHAREVAIVYAGSTNINLQMVKEGLAWHDEYNAPEAEGLNKSMYGARKKRRGLWADDAPVRPYDFRKGKTTPAPRVEVAADELLCDYVMDGDTFRSGSTRVRLWGIDAPEKGQPYADEARARLKELIEGKAVRLEWKDRDQHAREVAIVYAGSTNINLQMVKEGLAWHYAYFAPDAEDLAAAEKTARKSRKGLWKDKNPMNPYEFRKLTR